MRTRSLVILFLAVPVALGACGDNGGTGAGGGGTGGAGGEAAALPCDIDAILRNNCQDCHAAKPKFGAPMPLVTYADVHAPLNSDPSRKVYERMIERIHDDTNPMPPLTYERLSESEMALLDAWIADDAPAGEGGCGGGTGGTGGAGGVTLSCTPDVLLQPASPWVMEKDVTDIYVCYGVHLSFPQKRHVTALAPLIDNDTIVHHMVLFETTEPFPSNPTKCESESYGKLVGVWAPSPDGSVLELPPEAGYPLEGDTYYVLQIHYSNLNHLEGEQDSSGYQLCTTEELRPNDADIAAFGTLWLSIPPHGSADITCDWPVPAGAPTTHGIAGMPHMHKLGTQISTTLLKANGSKVDLGTAPKWSFTNQVWTPLDNKAIAQPGDTVRTRCAWSNPTSSEVYFGEKTSDEMCFGFVMYYPRIESPDWHWSLPAESSICTPTP